MPSSGLPAHPARRGSHWYALLGLVLAACADEGRDTPSGVTPDLLGYDRDEVRRQGAAFALEERVAQLAFALEAQRQQLDRQAALIADLTEAGKLRGRSIASLKKDQLAAAAQRGDDRAALESELDLLRASIVALEARLSRMAQDLTETADTAEQARMTANRDSAARMADAGDPVAGEIASGQSYGLHLASYRTESTAREGWRDLQRRHDDVLENLDMRLTPLDLEALGGRYMRLVAGPFAAVDDARAACENLRPRDQFCQVTIYRETGPTPEGD